MIIYKCDVCGKTLKNSQEMCKSHNGVECCSDCSIKLNKQYEKLNKAMNNSFMDFVKALNKDA